MWWGMQHRMTEPIMTKTMQMDYEQIGDERVRTLRARQDEYRKREKDVFERFLTQLEILLTSAVRMAAAIITIGPFFAKQFSKTAGTQETLFRIIAIAALFAVLYLNRRSVLEQGKRRLAIHNEHEDENRLNSYMMNEVVLSQKAGKDIRIFHQEPMMEHYGDQMNANWRRMTLQYAKNDVCHFGLQGMLSSCVGGIIYLYVAFCAYCGMITIGNVVRYAGAVQQFIQGMTDLFAGWSRLHHDRMQMDEYLEYMGLQNKMKKASRPVSLADMENPEVEFVDVSFRYPGTEQYVLRDVNVKISARESTAFVGLNGSGKTTFIKLLCRLYDPTKGHILLNGVDIREYEEAQYRKLFAVVFQDFKIFSFRFGENIAAGEKVDEERAMDAIRRVDLMRLYNKMPDGLNTMLNRDFSETGMEISGGEAQKTAMVQQLLEGKGLKKVVLFVSKKQKVRDLTRALRAKHIDARAMYSDLEQKERDEVMLDFRNGKVDVLVATDIISRGIDVDDIPLVINYDVPRDAEDYVHRIGRTARAENKGEAVTLVSPEDARYFQKIEHFLNKQIERLPLPDALGDAPADALYAPRAGRGGSNKGRSDRKHQQGSSKNKKGGWNRKTRNKRPDTNQ